MTDCYYEHCNPLYILTLAVSSSYSSLALPVSCSRSIHPTHLTHTPFMMKLDLRCTLLGSWSKFTVSGDGLLSGGLSSHKPRGQNWRERLVPVEIKVWITHEEESDKRKKGIKEYHLWDWYGGEIGCTRNVPSRFCSE